MINELRKYLKNISPEDFRKEWDEIEKLGLKGIPVIDFLNNVQHPNKTFVLDITKDTPFGKRKHIVIVAARDKETATQYLKDKLGFDGVPNELTWLMDCDHTTIYDQRGNVHPIQAKIMYNTVTMIKED